MKCSFCAVSGHTRRSCPLRRDKLAGLHDALDALDAQEEGGEAPAPGLEARRAELRALIALNS